MIVKMTLREVEEAIAIYAMRREGIGQAVTASVEFNEANSDHPVTVQFRAINMKGGGDA